MPGGSEPPSASKLGTERAARASQRGRVALILAGTAAILVGVLSVGGIRDPAELRQLQARRVVVFAVSPLGWEDLDRGLTPTLDEFTRTAAVGTLSVRTASRIPNAAEGFLSLGGGGRLDAGCVDPLALSCDVGSAFDAEAPLGASSAADVLESRTGQRFNSGIVVPGAVRAERFNTGLDGAGRPGALGDALADAGFDTAVVANADQPALYGNRGRVDRSAALAVADSNFHVSHGTVDADELLRSDPTAPFGVTVDRTRFLDAVDRATTQAEVVVVDPGELTRAERFSEFATLEVAERRRNEALRVTDELVADVRRDLADDTLLIVVSLQRPGPELGVTPMFIAGNGAAAGSIWSTSTKRLGVVAIGDLAPTVVGMLGADSPDDLPGASLAVAPGGVDVGHLRDLDRDTQYRERTYGTNTQLFVISAVAMCALACLTLGRNPGGSSRSYSLLRWWSVALAASPVAGFLLQLVPGITRLGWSVAVIGAAIALGVAWLAGRDRRHPLAPLVWVQALTVGVVIVDVVAGAPLHQSSWLGYSLHGGGRFYGIPNTTFAVLGSAAIIVGAAMVERGGRTSTVLAAVSALFITVIVVDGAPSLGSDVGGILTLVPLLALTFAALAGRRLRVRTAALVVVFGVLAVVGVAAIDLARPESSRTHLGRFAARFLDDPGTLLDIVARKQSANYRITQGSTWTWLVPAVIGLFVIVVVRAGRWATLAPAGSATRIALVAIAVGSVVGLLSNDSGPIVVALFLVPVLPIVVLGSSAVAPARSP